MKRTWQFGTVMGWTKAKGQVGQYGPHEDIGVALAHSYDRMHFIHLYEDNKLVAVKNIADILRWIGGEDLSNLDPNNAAYQALHTNRVKISSFERLVLKALNGGENERAGSLAGPSSKD